MNLKDAFACFLALCTMLVSAQAAEVTTTISDVHLCCTSCVKGAQQCVADIPGLTAKVSLEDSTIALSGPDKATVQKGANALTASGFFGKSSNADIKIDASTGATGQKVQTLTVSGVHLCCAKCVKAVGTALSTVPGYATNTAAKGAKTFQVTGNFTDTDIFAALQKAGLTGKVAP
jgi:copper chaperone CopZ